MSAGIANLIQLDDAMWEQVSRVANAGGGGVSSMDIWGTGELEYEAQMRVLDNMVGKLVDNNY